MRYPKIKYVRGSPDLDRAYVCPGRHASDGTIGTLAVGVESPAYRRRRDEECPRGVHMTLRQAELFALAIQRKVRQARRWNRKQRIKG